jgi:hypothetical protein
MVRLVVAEGNHEEGLVLDYPGIGRRLNSPSGG